MCKFFTNTTTAAGTAIAQFSSHKTHKAGEETFVIMTTLLEHSFALPSHPVQAEMIMGTKCEHSGGHENQLR